MDRPEDPEHENLGRRLKRGRDNHGNLWIRLGGFGLVASLFGLGSSLTAAACGFAVSLTLLVYGIRDMDMSNSATPEDTRAKERPGGSRKSGP